ncbi:MAG: GNAT family N-acetyltransferase [Defluviitaleaceae bacterium]|nr:GNAT family N-acetyltransferase [Defluviitaleaceae bacterium]
MIRPLEKSDIPRIAEIHIFAQRTTYRGVVPYVFLFKKMTVGDRIEYFKHNQTNGFVYDEDFIKGFITLGRCEDEDKADSLELYRIFVDPPMQGEGVGIKLAEHFEKVATEQGYSDICLWVLEGNTNARSFYEKLGYATDGAKRISEYFKVSEVRYSKLI